MKIWLYHGNINIYLSVNDMLPGEMSTEMSSYADQSGTEPET